LVNRKFVVLDLFDILEPQIRSIRFWVVFQDQIQNCTAVYA